MSKILGLLSEKGLVCYPSDRFSLDNFYFEPYQDEGQEFEPKCIFESSRSDKCVNVEYRTHTSHFRFFLDGSRYTYKIADMSTPDGKFMPVIAGQLATGVTDRKNQKIKKYDLAKKNVMLLYSHINDCDYSDIKKNIESKVFHGLSFEVDKYSRKDNDVRPENFAIAKLQKMMMSMEIDMLTKMVGGDCLLPDEMLVIDGSLQFMDMKAQDGLFRNVIGLSKSYNPNLTGLLKRKNHQIATLLANLQFRQRTPVYKYPIKNNRIIGAWYLRIRPKVHAKNPLDGVVKVEKIAVEDCEKEDGFDSEVINNISRSIILERNVTCYGKDSRWANHLYPIYLTEKMLKESFLSSQHFLNVF